MLKLRMVKQFNWKIHDYKSGGCLQHIFSIQKMNKTKHKTNVINEIKNKTQIKTGI